MGSAGFKAGPGVGLKWWLFPDGPWAVVPKTEEDENGGLNCGRREEEEVVFSFLLCP